MVLYGVVVVGPPGAGKSTMCAGLARYMELMKRPCAVVNLDPACEETGLTAFSVDVRNLCRVDEVMRTEKLGANGGLMYCVAQMRASPWLLERLAALGDENGAFPYVIFDLPGQVELWTHSDDLRVILETLVSHLDARLVVAHVVDANHCARPTSFVAAALVSLMAMLRLELPHVNVLSKLDQVDRFRHELPFSLQYFQESTELARLVPYCTVDSSAVPVLGDLEVPPDDDDADTDLPLTPLQRLSAKICHLVDDFSLVCFQPLDISDGSSVSALVALLDKAIGYPAAVHAPADLIENATNLFLAKDRAAPDPPKATRLHRRTFRTHALHPTSHPDDLPPPHQHDDDDDESQEEPFSWYRRGSLLRRPSSPPLRPDRGR